MSMLKMSAIKMCNLCEDVVELLVSFGLLACSWFGSTQLTLCIYVLIGQRTDLSAAKYHRNKRREINVE